MSVDAPLLIYDGECPMCRRAKQWIEEHTPPGSVEFVICQSDARALRAPQVSQQDCMRALQLVLPGGRVYEGERALPLVLAMTPRYRWLRCFFYLPGAGVVSHLVYRVVARNRMRLSAFFVSKEPGTSCSIDKGCS